MIPILLMADHTADPLWYRTPEGKGKAMIPLDSLPLSPELKAQLRAWARRHDSLTEWPSASATAEWVADGEALLDPLRQELGPEYDVQYFEGYVR